MAKKERLECLECGHDELVKDDYGNLVCDNCGSGNLIVRPQDKVTKDEKGKLKLSLVPASLEREVAKVREFASQKYGGSETWRENSKEQYFDALLRHVNAMRELGIEAADSESGCTHAAHVACNIAFIVDILRKETHAV